MFTSSVITIFNVCIIHVRAVVYFRTVFYFAFCSSWPMSPGSAPPPNAWVMPLGQQGEVQVFQGLRHSLSHSLATSSPGCSHPGSQPTTIPSPPPALGPTASPGMCSLPLYKESEEVLRCPRTFVSLFNWFFILLRFCIFHHFKERIPSSSGSCALNSFTPGDIHK